MILDPPVGIPSGGILFASFRENREFNDAANTYIANNGFISLTNDENNPRNQFYVVHPERNDYRFLVDGANRGYYH